MDVVYGIRRIYSIAREGVWGREGAGIALHQRAGGFFGGLLEAVFLGKNEVKSLLAALGVVLVALGLLLAFLVRSRGGLERSCASLGALLAALGGVLGRSLGHLGAVLALLGRLWGAWGSHKR